ncbi:MAG: Ig-like domain-containing protein [Gemmatimonadota bacterium]
MRQWIILGALALAACSGGTDATPPDTPGPVASVSVAAVTSTMIAGATQQLTAKLYDKDGKLVTTSSVTWSATPVSVATISATGLLTAVGPGTATVTASSGLLSKSVEIVVEADPCTTPITMRVGEVRSFTGGATVACVSLAPSTGNSDYVIIGANTRPTQDDLLAYSISTVTPAASIASSIAQASTVTASALAPGGPTQALVEERETAQVEALHERLRSYERAALTPIVHSVALQHAQETFARLAPTALSAIAAIGDTLTIRVPNLNTGKDICKDNIPVRAVVRAVSARATIIEDVNAPAAGFTIADYNAIAAEFDNLIFPTDTSWFGAPTDINNDGRISILLTPEVNKLTPAGSTGFTAGFFFGSDLIKKSEYPTTNECRNQTNEQEIFYVLAPDPTGQFNNVRTTVTVRQGTRGVIAHEFQHMINQGVRQYNPAVLALETFWLNEGMSHLAEEVVGRAQRGYGDFDRLTYELVNPSPSAANDYNAFFRQNLSRFQRWMARPDTSAPISARNKDQLAPRGASWALLRYSIDQFSNGAARAFTKALAAGPQTDIANLLARVPGTQFDQIITGWLVANYASGLNISGLATRYDYLSWNIRDAMSNVNAGTFPLLINQFPGTYTTQALSSSGNYFELSRSNSSAPVQVKLTNGSGGAITSDYATLAILRKQ